MGDIIVVQDQSKFIWRGVPLHRRYSQSMQADKGLLRQINEIDDLLDLKFYIPSQRWHLIRFYAGRVDDTVFIRVWELDDRPDLGLRKEPGEWMIGALRAADTWGRAENRIEEVDAHNAKVEEQNNRNKAEMALDFAKEIRKPLIHLDEYGPNSSYKGVF